MCHSVGARARLGRERVLTGTTRRVLFSLRRVIARPRRRGILGILLRNASRIQRSTRKRRDKLSAKFAEKYLHVRITVREDPKQVGKVFHQEIKRDPYLRSRNVPHIRKILEKEKEKYFLFLKSRSVYIL